MVVNVFLSGRKSRWTLSGLFTQIGRTATTDDDWRREAADFGVVTLEHGNTWKLMMSNIGSLDPGADFQNGDSGIKPSAAAKFLETNDLRLYGGLAPLLLSELIDDHGFPRIRYNDIVGGA